mgnify:FL=1
MLRRFVSKMHLILYFFSIAIIWLEAIITPALVQNIVASFTNQELDILWKVLTLGILGNLILLLGLAGKRYYYARLITDIDSENSRKISDLLFSLPQTVIEVIHHYTEEDLKHYDQVIHLSKEK